MHSNLKRLSHHSLTPLTWDDLQIARQEDTHSCGVLAINALAHFVQPMKFPLLSSSDTDIARLHYAILHNPLSLKIKIPRIPSMATPDILTSPTYVQVFKYLKIVIEAKFKSQHNPTLKGQTAADVHEAFICQFECYVKGQYPFDTMMDAGQDVLSYWTHLMKIPEGSILACIAEKFIQSSPHLCPRNKQYEQEEILKDEEDTWPDEMLAAKPAEDSTFDIEADANLHTLIVTKALSDEHKESPINGLCSTQGDATEDDTDLEGMDNEWDEFW
ncbi:hypothetical protein EDB19DRAFT_1910644 [Suillus lakei]|nr:hypothetical protein EDB19DRAFT_1910644 [Suillus lakei]